MTEKRIQAADVRTLCGNISDMTLWRWLNDQSLNFPQPIYIGRRRYWREADVLGWLDSLDQNASARAGGAENMSVPVIDGVPA